MSKEENQEQMPEIPEVAPEAETAETVPPAETPAEPTVQDLTDRLLRLQAEFDNYRKRIAREQAGWTARAVETLVLDILPALDSFDRALESEGEAAEGAALRDGILLVHRQLLGALDRHGVKPIEALGEVFDPNLHEGFMSKPAEPGEVPGTIVTEVQKGYRLGDRTIRATRGIVAAAETESGSEPSSEES